MTVNSLPPSPQPARWIAATCLLAAVTIALASTLVIRSLSSDEVGESGRGSAAAACVLIEQMPEDGFEDAASDGARVNVMRLSSALSLGMLAAEQDDSLQELSEALLKPQQVGGAKFDYTSDKVTKAFDDARELCADEGF